MARGEGDFHRQRVRRQNGITAFRQPSGLYFGIADGHSMSGEIARLCGGLEESARIVSSLKLPGNAVPLRLRIESYSGNIAAQLPLLNQGVSNSLADLLAEAQSSLQDALNLPALLELSAQRAVMERTIACLIDVQSRLRPPAASISR